MSCFFAFVLGDVGRSKIHMSAFSEEPFLNEKGVLVTEESCLTEKPLS